MTWSRYDDESDHHKAHMTVEKIDPDSPKEHKARLSHELIAAAASYEAAKAYEKHCEENGKPVSHAKAKEFLAALAGAAVDRLVESKGLDFIDKQKAEQQAKEHLHDSYDAKQSRT